MIVTHISFKCRDRQAMEQFYTTHFGFRRARVFNAGKPNELLLLKLASTRLELSQAPAGATACGPEPAVGYAHLAFEVECLETIIAALHAANIPAGPIRDCAAALPGMRVCFLKDPDGNNVELMQGYSDQL